MILFRPKYVHIPSLRLDWATHILFKGAKISLKDVEQIDVTKAYEVAAEWYHDKTVHFILIYC